jgi:hypothetical protein
MPTPNDKLKKLLKQSLRKLDKMANDRSGNKFNAKGQYYDGKFYHSTGERDYAMTLDLRKRAKDIKDWTRQVKIELRVKGRFIANYYIDFLIIHNDGSKEMVEYKGAETPEWRMKFELLLALKDELFPEGMTVSLVKHKSKYNPFKRKSK